MIPIPGIIHIEDFFSNTLYLDSLSGLKNISSV